MSEEATARVVAALECLEKAQPQVQDCLQLIAPDGLRRVAALVVSLALFACGSQGMRPRLRAHSSVVRERLKEEQGLEHAHDYARALATYRACLVDLLPRVHCSRGNIPPARDLLLSERSSRETPHWTKKLGKARLHRPSRSGCTLRSTMRWATPMPVFRYMIELPAFPRSNPQHAVCTFWSGNYSSRETDTPTHSAGRHRFETASWASTAFIKQLTLSALPRLDPILTGASRDGSQAPSETS